MDCPQRCAETPLRLCSVVTFVSRSGVCAHLWGQSIGFYGVEFNAFCESLGFYRSGSLPERNLPARPQNDTLGSGIWDLASSIRRPASAGGILGDWDLGSVMCGMVGEASSNSIYTNSRSTASAAATCSSAHPSYRRAKVLPIRRIERP